MSPPPDPLTRFSLRDYAHALRRGETTAEAVTAAYLERIRALDPKLGAFRTLLGESALKRARGIDSLRANGIDLGPLMGVPVAVKEIFAISGIPVGAGSEMDLGFLGLTQGPFVGALERAGCIVLGTTKTTEFAAATINVDKPMPWNPADESVKRVCGGSSHGSAAAMRAGLCAFSVGSDTGGSVRLPAALCGVFGYKSTAGRWSTEGVFALSPSMDSVGIFTRSADDAAVVFEALGDDSPPEIDVRRLKLGRPRGYFEEACDPIVLQRFHGALEALRSAGAEIVDIETPDIPTAMRGFGPLLFGEFVEVMGADRLAANKATIDRVPYARIEAAFGMTAEDLVAYRGQYRAAIAARLVPDHVDALLTPTAPFLPCPATEAATFETASAWNLRAGHCTRPGNFFGLCGTTIPIEAAGELPVGLQVLARPDDDRALLAISRAIERATHSPF